MRRWLLLVVPVLVTIWFSTRGREQAGAGWETVAAGVEMRRLQVTENGYATRVIAFRAAPSRVQIAAGTSLDATAWRRREGALLTVNGGYFDAEGRSLGLRIVRGRRTTPLHGTRWGIFRIKNGQAKIVAAADARDAMQRGVRYQYAIQCGPVLVADGQLGSFKAQWARRTGLGVARDGRVVIAVAEGDLSLAAWARTFRDQLQCPNALNLDGGSSTQLSLRAGQNQMEIRSGRAVPDAVLIR